MARIAMTLCIMLWLGQFAAVSTAGEPRLDVYPSLIELGSHHPRQQLAITLTDANGGVRDVTDSASFHLEPPNLAFTSSTGVVESRHDGTGYLRVTYQSLTKQVPLSIVDSELRQPVSFRLDLSPLLSKAGCNMGACHGNINGKGGFKLSLRGDDPSFDLAMITRDTQGRRVDVANPLQSLVFLKPTGLLPHEGGLRFSPGSTEAETLLGWVANGSGDDLGIAPIVKSIDVYPVERVLAAPSVSQQLVVTATFSDGTKRDVSRQSTYDVHDPTKASVSVDGRVSMTGPGETAVAMRYGSCRAVSRLAFVADRPDFTFRQPPIRNAIDSALFTKLSALKIQASPLATEPVFLRRAYLDAIGVLPSVDEARAFLANTDPEKRTKLIERLIARPEFADFWALKWADLLRNEEKTMGEKGVWIYQRWLRDQISRDLPLDEFARQVVATVGSTYSNPAASFHRTNRDPMTSAETVSQVFLGVRLQCARCHNHPFDVWTQNDYFGLAAYFSNVRRKQVNNIRFDALDTHEINGDEIIYLSGRPELAQPRTGEMMAPTPLHGPKRNLDKSVDALDDLANWLTRDNPQFAQNMANRVWFHLLGRGLVEPVDDFRESNPPSNPAILSAITAEFVKNDFQLKPLVAFIMNSTAYGLSATPDATNANDEINFARAAVKLLPAEVLLDAVAIALDQRDNFEDAPRVARASQLPGARMGGQFLKVFGKPDRLLTCECERSESTTLAQAFQLINGAAIRDKLESKDNRIGRLLDAGKSDEEILTELSLATLAELPTSSRRESLLGFVSAATDRRKAWEDVAWALINSKEFLLRH